MLFGEKVFPARREARGSPSPGMAPAPSHTGHPRALNWSELVRLDGTTLISSPAILLGELG